MTTFSQSISNSVNDGQDLDGAGFGDDAVLAGVDSFFESTHMGALRFTGVTVPNGTTITSATLKIYSEGSDDGTVTAVTVAGVAEDNCASWGSSLPSARSRTSATASIGHGGAAGTEYSVTITTLVQEILSRGGWASGNALGLIITATGGGLAGYQDVSEIGATPAMLSIVYPGGSPPPPPPPAYHAPKGRFGFNWRHRAGGR